jgi:hypothetical protein
MPTTASARPSTSARGTAAVRNLELHPRWRVSALVWETPLGGDYGVVREGDSYVAVWRRMPRDPWDVLAECASVKEAMGACEEDLAARLGGVL